MFGYWTRVKGGGCGGSGAFLCLLVLCIYILPISMMYGTKDGSFFSTHLLAPELCRCDERKNN